MRNRVPLLLAVLVLAAVAAGAAPAAAQPEPGETHFEIQLEDDGDARWTVVVAVRLEDEEDVEAFEAYAGDFEAGETDAEFDTDVFERAAEGASEASGREMAIQSVERDSGVVEPAGDEADAEGEVRRGELRLSFTWTDFGRIDENGTYYVDDAFLTPEGTWFPALDRGQTLTIRTPPGYASPTDAPAPPREGDLHWSGPRTFEPGYFEIVYHPASPGPAEGVDLTEVLLAAAVLLSALALVLAVYLILRRREGERIPYWPGSGEAGATTAAAGEAASNGGQGATATERADDGTGGLPDDELLSDEERVEYLLEQNGGRMKQADIVKETGWSNAKVSQLLSSMDDEDRVDKLRIGRENLISLPGEGLSDIESGSDED